MATREDSIEFDCLVRNLVAIMDAATGGDEPNVPTIYASDVCEAAIAALFAYTDEDMVNAAWDKIA